MNSKKLILFDIDGTLLTKSKVIKDNKQTIKEISINEALNEFYKCKEIDFTKSVSNGLTDWIISERAVQKIINHKIISRSEWINICHAVNKYLVLFKKSYLTTRCYEILPGVINLLSHLKSEGLEIGIMTGNIKCIAKYKLYETDLLSYFTIGGYAEDGKSRVDILQNLLNKAKNRKVYLVGDTIYDSNTAKENGINFIGVGTTGLEKNHFLETIMTKKAIWVKNLSCNAVSKWILEE